MKAALLFVKVYFKQVWMIKSMERARKTGIFQGWGKQECGVFQEEKTKVS